MKLSDRVAALTGPDRATLNAPFQDRKPPLIARIIACRRHVYWEGWTRTSIRAPYGEVSFGKIILCASLGNYGRPHFNLAIPGIQIFFRLPRWQWLVNLTCGEGSYGFSWRFGNDWQGDLLLNWGERCKIIGMPWGWNKRRGDYHREYLTTDGYWEDYSAKPHEWQDEPKGAPAWSEAHPYPYLTRHGHFQGDVTATITRERFSMVYRVFGFTVKRRVNHSIDVRFDKEVGSERGSWKGGTIGCSYDMKPGESPEQTLRRMRQERSFCR